MGMLRWMCEVTKKDVKESVKVAPVTKKITENRLKWYEHVKRRDVLRRMLDVPVPGKRQRGIQKTTWKGSGKRYIWKV